MAPQPSPTRPARPELIALLDACKDEPDDDAPRLVVADWLEEYGNESDRDRAEFIRLQLERDGEADLSSRERALLQVYGPSWLWPIIDAFDTPTSSGGVRHDRGLLDVEISLERLAAAHEQGELAGREQWAWVQALTLTDLDAAPMRLRGSPLLAGVTELRLSGGRCDTGIFAEMLDWPLERLLVLDLSDGGPVSDVMERLAGWRHLSGLRVLRLTGQAARDHGLSELAQTSRLLNLRELTATNSQISADGAAALGASAALAGLRRLDLSDAALGPEGVRALVTGSHTSLTHLRLDGTQASDDGVKAIAECPHLAGLRYLNLQQNGISSGGAVMLARSPHLGRLTRLDVAHNEIGGLGAFALLDSPNLADLTSLNLGANRIGPRWAKAVATRLRHRLALRSLRLFDNDLGPDGVAALADCAALSELRELDLGGNAVDDEGCHRLAATRTLTKLTHLDLSDNGITTAGAAALAESPALAELRELQLTGNHVGIEALRALVRRFGKGVVKLTFPENAATEET